MFLSLSATRTTPIFKPPHGVRVHESALCVPYCVASIQDQMAVAAVAGGISISSGFYCEHLMTRGVGGGEFDY